MVDLTHFSPSEFTMGGVQVFDKMDESFLLKLDKLRSNVGEPLKLTSTFRDKEYNKSIGGASGSKHIEGIAADISCNNGPLRTKLIFEALKLGLSVGVGKTFIHVDSRNNQTSWGYG